MIKIAAFIFLISCVALCAGDYATPYFWGARPELYSDYIQPAFNSTVAAGQPIGQGGLSQYLWNTNIKSLPGDDRSSAGVATAFGTNDALGTIIELLPRKSIYAGINSGTFAHPLRLDGFGRVMLGNVPEAYHTKFYPANAYLDLWTGGNSDAPAMRFEQDGLCRQPQPGGLERGQGHLWFTDGSGNRNLIMTTPANVFVHVSGTNVFLSTIPDAVLTLVTNTGKLFKSANIPKQASLFR